MSVSFRYRAVPSSLFGVVYRPVAEILVRHREDDSWLAIEMVVDTGADYTILPRRYAVLLGVDVLADCLRHSTHGVGGVETVYLCQDVIVRLGEWERRIPLGFLDRDDVPALLGRQEFFETFKVVFQGHTVTFDASPQ